MNRRPFLQLCLAALAVLGFQTFRNRPQYRFFWVDEDTEIFLAPDIATINRKLSRGLPDSRRYGPDLEPELTAENRGEIWDEVDGTGLSVRDEDGAVETLDAFRSKLERQQWFQADQCAQITTSYN